MWGQTLLHSQKIQHPIQSVLLQKTWENQSMVKYTDKYRKVRARAAMVPPPPTLREQRGGKSPASVGDKLVLTWCSGVLDSGVGLSPCSAVTVTCSSSEKGICGGLGLASEANIAGHDPLAASPSIAYSTTFYCHQPPLSSPLNSCH